METKKYIQYNKGLSLRNKILSRANLFPGKSEGKPLAEQLGSHVSSGKCYLSPAIVSPVSKVMGEISLADDGVNDTLVK